MFCGHHLAVMFGTVPEALEELYSGSTKSEYGLWFFDLIFNYKLK